jgi:orotate phosphoribosyltransferase
MKQEIAKILLEIKAVKLSLDPPFTWASGIKSPIYCDNRKLMGYPEKRNIVRDAFIEKVKDYNPEIIAGTATAGIPHAAWIAEKMNLPMIYIRSSNKGHGLQNKIEGVLEKGKKVLVIEDLISTGGSSIDAANAVSEAGGDVLGVLAIFTYQLAKATERFSEANIKFDTLTNFTTLIDIAIEENYLSEGDKESVLNWYKNPAEWMVNS